MGVRAARQFMDKLVEGLSPACRAVAQADMQMKPSEPACRQAGG